jgi:hypothetical protein
VQLHKHAAKQGCATQSKAELKTPNPRMGRKTGLNHPCRGLGKTAQSLYVLHAPGPLPHPGPAGCPLGPGARGGIMFDFPRRLVVVDVSVIHTAATSFARGAARTPRFVAATSDASKLRAQRQVSSALPFVPMSVKSCVRLGAPALALLGGLTDQAMQAGGPSLHLGGAPGARRCPVPRQCVPVSAGRVRRGASRWLGPDARSCPALD